MRRRLDCAILDFDQPESPHSPSTGVYANGRLHVHHLEGPDAKGANTHALASMALVLQRFDACLLAIREGNLAWARLALLTAGQTLTTPVIGMVDSLKAPAINDLYNAGMCDFVRGPVCPEELRVRIERLLSRTKAAPRYAAATLSPPEAVSETGAHYAVLEGGLHDEVDAGLFIPRMLPDRDLRDHPSVEYGDVELEAFAVASASRCARSTDSFSIAKGKVIDRFERAYLLASLAKSSGNIALAARGAKKHRRAYWALMRKHDIDAEPFRNRCLRIHNSQDG